MTNLSELLPAGGGQNNVDFTADSTGVNSGKPCIINSDGTISEVAMSALSNYGLDQSSNALIAAGNVSGNMGQMVYVRKEDRYYFFWGYSAQIKYVSFTVNDAGSFAISGIGTGPSNLYDNKNISFCYDHHTGRGAYTYNYAYGGYSSSQLYYGTLDFSNGSVTFGSGQAGNYYSIGGYCCSDNKGNILFVYEQFPNYYPYVFSAVLPSSGGLTNISGETNLEYNGGYWHSHYHTEYIPPEDKFQVVHSNSSNVGRTTFVSLTGAGSTPSQGSAYNIWSSSEPTGHLPYLSYDPVSTYMLFIYNNSSNYPAAVLGYTNLSFFSAQGQTVVESTTTNTNKWTKDVKAHESGNVAFTYERSTQNQPSRVKIATFTYGSTSFNWQLGPSNLYSDATATTVRLGAGIGNGRMAYAACMDNYQTSTAFPSNNMGKAGLIKMPASNKDGTNLLGLAAGAIGAGQSGTVNIWGSLNEAQTGLTAGSDYYVQGDGTISTDSTSSSAELIGQAISATQINIRDYNK